MWILLVACKDDPAPRIVRPEPRSEWPPEPVELQGVDWVDTSPDEHTLTWSERESLHLLDLWTGERTEIPDVPEQSPVWSLDSSLLVFVRARDTAPLFAVREGELMSVGVSASSRSFSVAPDGSGVLFRELDRTGTLWRLDGAPTRFDIGYTNALVDPRSGLMGWDTSYHSLLVHPDGHSREVAVGAVVSAEARVAWGDGIDVQVETFEGVLAFESPFDVIYESFVWSEGGETLAIHAPYIGDDPDETVKFLLEGEDELREVPLASVDWGSLQSRGERFVFRDEGNLYTWVKGRLSEIGEACDEPVAMSSFVLAFNSCPRGAPDQGWMYDLLTEELVGPLASEYAPVPYGEGVLHRDPATNELWFTRRTGSERLAQDVTHFATNGEQLAYVQSGRIVAEVVGELPELEGDVWLGVTQQHLLVFTEESLWVALLKPSS